MGPKRLGAREPNLLPFLKRKSSPLTDLSKQNMNTPENLLRLQEEMRVRTAARRKKKEPSAHEAEKGIRKRRLKQRNAYHAKRKEAKRLKREAAAKIRAEKLAARAERRALWEQKKAEREAKKAARRDPVKKLSKQDRAFIDGFEAGTVATANGMLKSNLPFVVLP